MKNVQTNSSNTPVKATFRPPQTALPSSAQVVIVGGGIAGASLAYHFAKAGWTDVCLLEQNQLASGTTWHSAGQVGQLRSSSAQTRVNKESALLYARLASETGHDPGWLQCGGLQLAASQERMHQLQRNAAMADVFGVEAQIITPDQCRDYWPMLRTDDLYGGVYLPGDGRVLPGECTVALAKSALRGGVQFIEGVSVQRLLFSASRHGKKRFTGLQTSRGEIHCEWIVLAGNMWMRQLGLTAEVDIPVYPCEHHYVITKPIDGVTRNSPCTRDPDAGNYFRALDDGSLKLGAFKKRSKPWQIEDHVPHDFAFSLLDSDWPDFAEPFASHMHRLPGIDRAQVVKFVNGPEAFTPDNQFIMGQPFLTDGLFVMGGWNSAGIACAGGAGKYAVEWLENGGMTLDLCSVDIKRFMPFQNQRAYLTQRVSEVLGLHYQMAWPGREMETARGQRASALFAIHQQANAVFGETAGWERPRFYAPANCDAQIEYSFVQQNWHDWVADEVRQCRENVAILDQSTFGKFRVQGKDALSVLQNLCGADLDREPGRAVYTGMFNDRGTYEADLIVARFAKDEFYLITSTAQQRKDFDWIARHLPANANARLTDVTDEYGVIGVMGPNSQELLHRLAPEAFPNAVPRYGTVRELSVAGVDVMAIYVSYVGEPGWELHVSNRDAVKLYQAIKAAGEQYNVRPIGTQAISAMRIEKGFRAFGHELSPAEDPFQAGLQHFIDWNKPFIGKEALLALQANPPMKRLACLQLVDDPDVTLWGGEPIYWDDQIVGYTTSACHSPTIGRSIAMGYVRADAPGLSLTEEVMMAANFAITQMGERRRARASLRPFV